MSKFINYLNEGKTFKHSHKIAVDDVKTILKKNKEYSENEEDSLILIYKGRTHIMTYDKKTGTLMTDKDLDSIKAILY